MKETIFLCARLLFVFFPWMIGIVDVLSWALFGSQLTNIPWGEGRGALLVLWPFFWTVVVTWVVKTFHL